MQRRTKLLRRRWLKIQFTKFTKRITNYFNFRPQKDWNQATGSSYYLIGDDSSVVPLIKGLNSLLSNYTVKQKKYEITFEFEQDEYNRWTMQSSSEFAMLYEDSFIISVVNYMSTNGWQFKTQYTQNLDLPGRKQVKEMWLFSNISKVFI